MSQLPIVFGSKVHLKVNIFFCKLGEQATRTLRYIILTLLVSSSLFVNSQKIHIHPYSLIAKIARDLNHTDRYAVTIGNNIFVSTPIDSFLADKNWIVHEFTHVKQYRKLGTLEFLKRYLWFSLWHGYRNNPLEVEAFDSEGE